MAHGASFLRIFEPAFDPTLVDDPERLLEVLNSSERLVRLLTRRDDRGFTLLHYAAEKNQPESLKCLLVKQADPNIRTSRQTDELTPLHVAAANGHLACLKVLIELGGNPLARDQHNMLPSDHARRNEKGLCLDYLEELNAERAQQGTEDLQELLVFVEQSIQHKDIDGLITNQRFNKHFPLNLPPNTQPPTYPHENIVARKCGLLNSPEVLQVLTKISRVIPVALSEASVLHAACCYGNQSLVHLLLRHFPQLLYTKTLEGYTPFHIAVTHRQTDILQMMINTLQQMKQRTNSSNQESTEGHTETTPTEESISLAGETSSGHNALHFAVCLNDWLSLSVLLEYAKDLEIEDVNTRDCGYSPLHLAVHLDHKDSAQRLLKAKAKPNIYLIKSDLDMFSPTPLAEAAMNGNISMVQLLVKSGAEDRKHEALKLCLKNLPEKKHLMPILLSSLVKCDETATKQFVMAHSRRDTKKLKMAAADWGKLEMGYLDPSWVFNSFASCPFLLGQGLEAPDSLTYVTNINLQDNKLVEVPFAVFQLASLLSLNLSGNNLTTIPSLEPRLNILSQQMEQPCFYLQRLLLSKNKLTEVPEFLFQLPSLQSLDLSNNAITSLPLAMWSAPKLTNLNCAHNKIAAIPTNWSLVQEQYRFVDISQRPTSPPPSSNPTLTTVGNKTVSSLVTQSSTHNSEETDESVTFERARQTRLYDRLNVCNANLTIEWGTDEGRDNSHDGLQILNLSHNLISEIPENLPCLCPKLTRLTLNNNKISKLLLPKAVPSGLRQLSMSNNEIEVLDSLKARLSPYPCTNPKVLAACGDTIYVDPKVFCTHRQHNHLINLSMLDASYNKIVTVRLKSPIITVSGGPCQPDGRIREVDIPLFAALASASGRNADAVRQLARLACPLLTRLILHHNQITEVPESVCDMTSLNSLDLSFNNIIELRPELGKLCNLWEFPLEGLELISPPHNIIERGKTKDIIGFLWSLLQRARPYHRMKLMLVGKAGRGKTTLLKRISEKGQRGLQENWMEARLPAEIRKTRNLSTVGIVVSDWTYTKRVHDGQTQTGLRNITFMTWDFGGQEEYYATHQCFLSRRSLYLVVWRVTDGRRGVEELKPWLLNIQARAPNSPVIIVGTHLDKASSRAQKRELQENLALIDKLYGHGSSLMQRQHGFPNIMRNMVVSCGLLQKGIDALRDAVFDVACQVKENTVAGRGIGCGRIPEYRLLMDQLVPASYLQLEDSIRNIAITLRLLNKPPVLTYKEFREMVFTDTFTMVSRNVGDRELEQAVRFLHDNGTLLHYEDPLLKDLYFVDPQWLVDMLAHIVTVREINPFVRDGIMKIRDFALLFNDDDFPIRWQREYLRLLTTFEVAVEFKQGRLLIPSHLPPVKPPLPQCIPPENTCFLPPLRHAFLLAFVPSGFWPRLMSRLLSDRSIFRLAQKGCGLTDRERRLLKWTKWRSGMILRFGNVVLLTVEEVKGSLFNSRCEQMAILRENSKWEKHSADTVVYGVDVSVPDVYPLLKYAEVHPRQPATQGQVTEMMDVASHIDTPSPHPQPSGRPRRATFTQRIGDAFRNKIPRTRSVHQGSGGEGEGNKSLVVDVSSSESEEETVLHHRPMTLNQVEKEYEKLRKQRRYGNKPRGAVGGATNQRGARNTPHHALTEETSDRMRAGLLSKVVDHIALLLDDWFTGVRPRFLVVPCPHCSMGLPSGDIPLQRSFSVNPSLRPSHLLEAPKLPRPSTLPFNRRGGRSQEEEEGVRQCTLYAFQYDECIVLAREQANLKCPIHGDLPLEYLAPDTLFLTEGRDMLFSPEDVQCDEIIGSGAFATVYKARLRHHRHSQLDPQHEYVAIKALTKNLKEDLDEDLDEGREERSRSQSHPQRHQIITGFNNLKKELSILSPLHHENIVELIGVTLTPLGLVLELAPRGSLRSILKEFVIASQRLQPAAIQAVIIQVAEALQYLHYLQIIYRDLKCENILVWQFPSPHTSLSPSIPVNKETVYIKLSDYGISQYAANHGARGLVGTPGFIAPEILKYHGKEAYNSSVDIFSFAMMVYELITKHMPFQNLTPNQANQANENGARPTLKKKDLPCPVLIRELMVWCWQQDYDERPSADSIIEVAHSDQFLRLADAIRINNFQSQATGSCYRIVRRRSLRFQRQAVQSYGSPSWSPAHTINPFLSMPGFGKRRGVPKDSMLKYHHTIGGNPSYFRFGTIATSGAWCSGAESGYQSQGTQASDSQRAPSQGTQSSDAQTQASTRVSQGTQESEMQTPDTHTPGAQSQGTLASSKSGDSVYKSACSSLAEPPQRRMNRISDSSSSGAMAPPPPLLFDRSPHEEDEDEEEMVFEVWVVSAAPHCSVATVIEYCGQFISIEDIDLGDSPVLCIQMVEDKVWVGFQIGYLCVYDANTHQSLLQSWVRQGVPVLCLASLPCMGKMFVGLDDGSVYSFSDSITPFISFEAERTLKPLAMFEEHGQMAATLLVVPRQGEDDKVYYDLWVGQSNMSVVILNSDTLEPLMYLDNPLDHTPCPTYLTQLTYSHLTSNIPSDAFKREGLASKPVLSPAWHRTRVDVYAALQHGRCITRWNANRREIVECMDCRQLLVEGETGDVGISALYFCDDFLYIGLAEGQVIIMDAISFKPLTILRCHRSQVRSFLPINLSLLQSRASSSTSTPSHKTSTSSFSPLHTASPLLSPYRTGLLQLMSFGTGFKAYYESTDTLDYSESAFLLVWEAGEWEGSSITNQYTV